MTKRDWLIVGLKLMGIYFCVQGVVTGATLVSTYFQLYVNNNIVSRGVGIGLGPGDGIPLQFFLGPGITLLAYLLAAFFLIRQTKFCLLFVYPWAERDEIDNTAP